MQPPQTRYRASRLSDASVTGISRGLVSANLGVTDFAVFIRRGDVFSESDSSVYAPSLGKFLLCQPLVAQEPSA